jgi:hypothetical protein
LESPASWRHRSSRSVGLLAMVITCMEMATGGPHSSVETRPPVHACVRQRAGTGRVFVESSGVVVAAPSSAAVTDADRSTLGRSAWSENGLPCLGPPGAPYTKPCWRIATFRQGRARHNVHAFGFTAGFNCPVGNPRCRRWTPLYTLPCWFTRDVRPCLDPEPYEKVCPEG